MTVHEGSILGHPAEEFPARVANLLMQERAKELVFAALDRAGGAFLLDLDGFIHGMEVGINAGIAAATEQLSMRANERADVVINV